MTKFNRTN